MSPAAVNRFQWYAKLFGGMQSAPSIHFLTMLSFFAFIVVHVTLIVMTGIVRNMNHIVMGTDDLNHRGTILGFVGIGVVVLSWVAALIPELRVNPDASHLSASLSHDDDARKRLDDLATGESGRKPIHPQYVGKILDELAAEDAVFTCGVGKPTIWAARYIHMNGKRRLLGSFTHGSMANAVPQAIGAQVSHHGRQVISLYGDGGLAMLMGDLLSHRQLQPPVKLIVFNNSSLAFVELEMKVAGILDFGTDLQNPDFAKMAEAAGVLGLRTETADQVWLMIEQALGHDGPALVEAIVSRQELPMPPTITIDQIKGFSLFMIKAVLDGRGNEIIDLAKANLVR